MKKLILSTLLTLFITPIAFAAESTITWRLDEDSDLHIGAEISGISRDADMSGGYVDHSRMDVRIFPLKLEFELKSKDADFSFSTAWYSSTITENPKDSLGSYSNIRILDYEYEQVDALDIDEHRSIYLFRSTQRLANDYYSGQQIRFYMVATVDLWGHESFDFEAGEEIDGMNLLRLGYTFGLALPDFLRSHLEAGVLWQPDGLFFGDDLDRLETHAELVLHPTKNGKVSLLYRDVEYSGDVDKEAVFKGITYSREW